MIGLDLGGRVTTAVAWTVAFRWTDRVLGGWK